MSDSFDFDGITPVSIPVRVGGKRYILREATGDVAVRYRNACLKAMKLGADGKPVAMENMADVEPYLVHLTLFAVAENGGESQVPLATVRGWPARVVKALFNKAKEIGSLDEADTKEQLQARIDADQAKLAALSNGHAEKNEPLTAGSGSPVT